MDGPIYDVVIIGGGPAGFTAALYASRAGLDTAVFEKSSAGGQMALTTQIDNYPGFADGIDGFTLGEQMRRGAERFGTKIHQAEVLRVDCKAVPKTITTTDGMVYGKTVVLATGATPRELGLPGEKELVGRGVAYCAACDGRFYKGKTVAVIGGGNSAAADALYLSRIAKKVVVVHRRDTLRASRIYHGLLEKAGNIEFRWNSVVSGLLAEESVTGITLLQANPGKTDTLSCDGVFVSIGREPASGLAKGQLDLDAGGYIAADESTCTGIPGVYAAGDVRAKALRQIVTAVADGAVAAHHAESYLAEHP